MRASDRIYEEVAHHCSAYQPNGCSCKNTAGEEKVSCTTCKHFVKGEYCDIDLYDEIVKDHNLL